MDESHAGACERASDEVAKEAQHGQKAERDPDGLDPGHTECLHNRRLSRDVQELAVARAALGQPDEALRVMDLAASPEAHFVMSVPQKEQTDPSVSTE